MNARFVQQLMRLERRVLLAIMAALLLLLAFELWVLVLRPPLAEYRSLLQLRLASQAVAPGPGLAGEIDTLAARAAANARALADAAPAAAEDDAVLELIDTLGRLANSHDVALGRVAAGRRTALAPSLAEQSFDIEARGDYRALHAWLSDVRRELEPLVVAELGLRSLDGGQRVALTLRLASYSVQPAGTPGATP